MAVRGACHSLRLISKVKLRRTWPVISWSKTNLPCAMLAWWLKVYLKRYLSANNASSNILTRGIRVLLHKFSQPIMLYHVDARYKIASKLHGNEEVSWLKVTWPTANQVWHLNLYLKLCWDLTACLSSHSNFENSHSPSLSITNDVVFLGSPLSYFLRFLVRTSNLSRKHLED